MGLFLQPDCPELSFARKNTTVSARFPESAVNLSLSNPPRAIGIESPGREARVRNSDAFWHSALGLRRMARVFTPTDEVVDILRL
jgi:hypothetical protein